MGSTKFEKFSYQQNRLAHIAKVLGHPARIAILQQIAEHDSCVCGDLVNEIGLAQATISQHLKELKKIGLIKGEVEGTSVCYCIDFDVYAEFAMQISTFIKPNDVACDTQEDGECC